MKNFENKKIISEINENDKFFKISFPSKWNLVEYVLNHARKFINKFYSCGYIPEFEIISYELLSNAIEHGNKNNPEKNVFFEISFLLEKKFRITVEDEGEGFDFKAFSCASDSGQSSIKRGYHLIEVFSDKIEYNNKGNRISVYFSLNDISKVNKPDSGMNPDENNKTSIFL